MRELHEILLDGQRPAARHVAGLMIAARGDAHDAIRDESWLGDEMMLDAWLAYRWEWWNGNGDDDSTDDARRGHRRLSGVALPAGPPDAGRMADSIDPGHFGAGSEAAIGRDGVLGSPAGTGPSPTLRRADAHRGAPAPVACVCSRWARFSPLRAPLRAALADVAAARSILATCWPAGRTDPFCYVIDGLSNGMLWAWSGRIRGAHFRSSRLAVAAPGALRSVRKGVLLGTGGATCAGDLPCHCGLCGGLLGTGDIVNLALGSELAVHPVFGIN